jgi:glucose-1-phosphate thymidylyltransferase
MKGLILAGGHGTRLRPLTFTGNKHMIPIANKPMLFYGLEHIINAGIKEIAIILGPVQEGIREILGDGSKYGVTIDYIYQPEPKGLAHAVQISEKLIGTSPFVMYLGDNLIKQGVVPLIRTFYNENSDCVICVSQVENPRQYGVVELDPIGNVKRLVEKPDQPMSNLALAGVYLFNQHIFEAVNSIKPSWRNELEITDAIQFLLEKERKISVQKIHGWWKDTGKPQDLLEANQLILDETPSTIEVSIDPGCQVMGKVSIKEGTVIKPPNTSLKGPTIIGRNCVIGPNVHVGPYTAIGDNSTIISGEIEGSIVMDNVYINCKKRIVDSIIGSHSVIEAGDNDLPSGSKLIVGENTFCRL